MEESRELATVVEASPDERLVERVLAAAAGAPIDDRVQAGVEALVELAEVDPEGASSALASLRANPVVLQKLEDGLGLPLNRATLALGAAIQLARSELASAAPDLRARVPELLAWLEGRATLHQG